MILFIYNMYLIISQIYRNLSILIIILLNIQFKIINKLYTKFHKDINKINNILYLFNKLKEELIFIKEN